MKFTDKDTAEICRHVREHGWRVEKTSNHVKLYAPSGQMVITPSTPSDWRSKANTISLIRRIDPTCFPRPTKAKKEKQ